MQLKRTELRQQFWLSSFSLSPLHWLFLLWRWNKSLSVGMLINRNQGILLCPKVPSMMWLTAEEINWETMTCKQPEITQLPVLKWHKNILHVCNIRLWFFMPCHKCAINGSYSYYYQYNYQLLSAGILLLLSDLHVTCFYLSIQWLRLLQLLGHLAWNSFSWIHTLLLFLTLFKCSVLEFQRTMYILCLGAI